MGNRHWVGGTDNWNGTVGTKWSTTSGGAGGSAVPTASDDVFFDANSAGAVVTISGSRVCNNLTCTGFTGDIKGSSGITISGNLVFAATHTASYTGTLTFNATGAGHTVTTGGITLNCNFTFNGVGGVWTLQDAVVMTGDSFPQINLSKGTLDTNGQTITADQLDISGTSTRVLTLGASAITLTRSSTTVAALDAATVTNLTLNANTSTITMSGTNALFNGGGKTYRNVVFTGVTGAISITGANSYTNLTWATGGQASTMTLSANQTVTGTLTLTGAAPSTRPLIQTDTSGTARTVTAAAVALTDVDFTDITAAGAASPFTGTRLGNCIGNTNVTTTIAASKYWVGNTADWQSTSWAATSGGAAGVNNYPLPQDTAVFDTNSFSANSQTVTISVEALRIGPVNWSAINKTGITWALGTVNVSVYAATFVLDTTLTMSGSSGNMTWMNRGAQSITFDSAVITKDITIDSVGGTVTLVDTFSVSGTVTLTRGTLTLSNQSGTFSKFSSNGSGTRTVTLGSGTLTLSGTGTMWSVTATLTVTATTGTIKLTNTSSGTKLFAGAGLTYCNIWITGAGTGEFTFSGSNTFTDFKADTPPHTIKFTAGTTTTVATFTVAGTAGNLMTIGSITAAQHTLTKSGGGTISKAFLSISYSNATPGSTWTATTSVDGGNNTGWTIQGAGGMLGFFFQVP